MFGHTEVKPDNVIRTLWLAKFQSRGRGWACEGEISFSKAKESIGRKLDDAEIAERAAKETRGQEQNVYVYG